MAVFPEVDTDSGHWRKPTALGKYAMLIRRVRNWPLYVIRRWPGRDETVLVTRRGPLRCLVPRQLAPAFREVAIYDTYEIEGMAGELGKAPVVIDVGANAGYFSLYLSAHVPGAHVYAYEPLPGNFAVLERNLALNPAFTAHLHVFPLAVTGQPCESIDLHVQTSKELSMVASVHQHVITEETRAIRVGATTLAQLMAANCLEHIDLLKLDCEGAEYEILFETPPETLARVRRIVLETHVRPGLKFGHADMVWFLKAQGYAVREMVQHENLSHLIWARRRDLRAN